MSDDIEARSKFLAFVLRHEPEAIGLVLDPEGWVDIAELVARATAAGRALSVPQVLGAARSGNKRRYEISADESRIRALQGHSTGQVRRQLEPREPPSRLFHGTASRFVASIEASGLQPAGRHHVHLSSDRATATEVGRRHGSPVVFEVDAGRMRADGHSFYLAENGVWLTEAVPARYLHRP